MLDQNVRLAVERLLNSLATTPTPSQCDKCSSALISVDATLSAPGGRTFNVPLPMCPRCDLDC
jgi:hypothetical protein